MTNLFPNSSQANRIEALYTYGKNKNLLKNSMS